MGSTAVGYLTFFIVNVITMCHSKGTIHEHNKGLYKTVFLSNSSFEGCRNIYRSLKPEQKARFVDASGKPGSGIYGGNTLWYGSFSECQKIPESRYCWTMFPGEISLVKNKTETYHFEWGVCIPSVCTNEDVTQNFEFLFKNVSGIRKVTLQVNRLQVKCAEDPEYTTSVVLTIVFCGVLVGICLLATLVDIFGNSNKPHEAEIVDNGGCISMDKDANEKTALIPNGRTEIVNNKGLFQEILHSFSMIRNIKSIMSTNVAKSDLTYLHGIRVLSLFWIILIHINYFTIAAFPFDNLNDVIRFERRLLSLILNTAHGVDTFFVLGGLLVMYTNLGKKTKNNGATNWFKYYFHRFWRLTPTMMFFILFYTKLRPFIGAGPLWFFEADTSACSENWWTNLLYLNNFIHASKKCVGHTWYLSIDMQFFVISPFFLLIAYRYGLRPLLCVVGVVILASIIVTASIVANKDSALPVYLAFKRLNTFFSNNQEEVFHGRALRDINDDVYFKPWSRIPPYVMGLALGYVIYKHYAKNFKLPWVFVGLMWISAIALALTDVYAPYSAVKEDPRIWTTGEEVVFWSLRWVIWGLCIVWLIFACHYNYAGLVRNVLDAKFWIPLSHINYAAYIVHVDVILALGYNIESPIHYTTFTLAPISGVALIRFLLHKPALTSDNLRLATLKKIIFIHNNSLSFAAQVNYFLSSLVLTYAIAFMVAVVVELPCANLEALAWKRWERK